MLDDLGHNEADEDKGSPPPIIFAQLLRPMNALQLCR